MESYRSYSQAKGAALRASYSGRVYGDEGELSLEEYDTAKDRLTDARNDLMGSKDEISPK